MTTFKHSPLSDSTNEIRLLDLQPGQRGELLDIYIRQTQLSHLPSYEALSYTWGTESASHHVSINGSHFAVRPNLFHCLNELRLATSVRTLWIDAICIDQTNIQERNQQVAEMRNIYAKAAQVRIWVGQPNSRTKELFEYLNASETERAALTWSSFSTEGLLVIGEPRETPLVDGLIDICSREYWGRAWIRQEIMVSGSKVVHCGPYSTPLDHIHDAVTSTRLGRMKYPLIKSQTTQQTLEELLENYGEAACGDIKDRIYALLGVAKDCTTNHPFHIDYAEDEYVLLCRTINFCNPKNPIEYASRLFHILSIDKTSVQQYIQLYVPEAKSKHVKVELPAYYFGTASDISTSGLEGRGCFRWKCVKHKSVLGKLIARKMLGGSLVPPSSYHEIKIFQIEGSPIGFLLTSVTEEEEMAFIPVVIQQVEGLDKDEIILYRFSNIVYNVLFKGGFPMFRISIFVQPELFTWLIAESEKWRHVDQPWVKRGEVETAQYSAESSIHSVV